MKRRSYFIGIKSLTNCPLCDSTTDIKTEKRKKNNKADPIREKMTSVRVRTNQFERKWSAYVYERPKSRESGQRTSTNDPILEKVVSVRVRTTQFERKWSAYVYERPKSRESGQRTSTNEPIREKVVSVFVPNVLRKLKYENLNLRKYINFATAL